MHETGYTFTKRLPQREFDEVVAKVRETLSSEGFGVLTEIDVQATLKKKLGVDRAPYLILGACNPALAHRALEAEAAIGVLLPCNVDVFVGGDGVVHVQAIDPRRLFELVGKPEVKPIADEVAERLQRVLAAV